ncbi:hypothetical protein F5H01DRAFT_316418 [Linnemannia elongata]|nr:hypothetical protein F5H01DRAFT_316418 [Linnemannia elongata]
MRSAPTTLTHFLLAIVLGILSVSASVSAAAEVPLNKCQKCIADIAKAISPTCSRDVFASLLGADMDKKQQECVCPLGLDTNWLLACKLFEFCAPDTVEYITKELQGRHEKSCLGAAKPEATPSGTTTALTTTTTTALDSLSTSTLLANPSNAGTGSPSVRALPNGTPVSLGNPSFMLAIGSTLITAAAMAAFLL